MAYDPLSDTSSRGFGTNLEYGDVGGLARNVWEGARDEWLGIDDFRRFAENMGKGNFLKALKSLGTGALELGGTAMMFVPGGQGVTAAVKGAKTATKAGKAVKAGAKAAKAVEGENIILRWLRPLNLSEQEMQRALLRQGVKRRAASAPAASKKVQDKALKALRKFEDLPVAERVKGARIRNLPIGASRGGVAGSLVRGAGQYSGMLPISQGLLAGAAKSARAAGRTPGALARAGEFASGKVTPLLARTGLDTQLTKDIPVVNTVMGTGEQAITPTVSPNLLSGQEQLTEEELTMILAMLEQGGYGTR